MPPDTNKALLVIQQQLKELDAIYQDTMEMSLNTVAGTERVAKWRVRTVALLAEQSAKKPPGYCPSPDRAWSSPMISSKNSPI